MLMLEPIVFLLSILSGFADAFIFSLESYDYIFEQGYFKPMNASLVLVALACSYVVDYVPKVKNSRLKPA